MCGQLGLGDHDRLVPTLVDDVNGVVAVSAGEFYSLALGRNGTVMTCGDNDSGQLGLGDTAQRDTFTVVPSLSDVVDIDAEGDHTIAVTCGGEVWTWGRVDGDFVVNPSKVTGGIDDAVVVQVAAGYYHSMALTATGGLYSWGKGSSGQLGHGDKENLAVPRVVGGIGGAVGMAGGTFHSLVTTVEGHVLGFGGNGGVLGLGAEVGEALVPTAIDGITMGEGDEGKEGKE
jgi:alpha-tubulin suppressor-like RCC1 family protein